jgi:flagellar export protein FliJ
VSVNKFHFKLSSLLTHRERERDRCRQALAAALAAEQVLQRQQQSVDTQRTIQIDELRQLTKREHVDVVRWAARRTHADQLTQEIQALDSRRILAQQHIENARRDLTHADQEVKALEKLAEKQAAEHGLDQDRRLTRELDEASAASFRR